MIGTIRWNFIIGLISLVITFGCSIVHNIWLTSFIRSVYSFIIVFAIVFLFRWVLGTVAGFNQLASAESAPHASEEEGKGTALDLTTPDEEASLHQMLKGSPESNASAGDSSFEPLNPPKLSSRMNNAEPGEMAQAVRRMTEE
ncbi:hypothetical protein N0M98_17175 [Paenibacillus doosanensis]|uniref:Uncharacterized protein n=1 Tax=Paenibacillus konkukensis TaxID=2020716 RepID=A0ABY4RY69_9BACL|nr:MULTISPECIES: hypothetical protein [Paenibacillus]MCS7461871.1 hypothetical protein [Paenibacillus doosanensis]UQZ87360.1 hypothetical protein SK3146_06657 [Paenibacillus konkukensis]